MSKAWKKSFIFPVGVHNIIPGICIFDSQWFSIEENCKAVIIERLVVNIDDEHELEYAEFIYQKYLCVEIITAFN